MKTKRIIIYPKDVQRITGKSERAGRALLMKIKKTNDKTKHQFVSVNEFADFTGLSVEEITSYLLD
jgi:hypothetical protein